MLVSAFGSHAFHQCGTLEYSLEHAQPLYFILYLRYDPTRTIRIVREYMREHGKHWRQRLSVTITRRVMVVVAAAARESERGRGDNGDTPEEISARSLG